MTVQEVADLVVVSLARHETGSPSARVDEARAVARACADIGFFLLIEHGVAEEPRLEIARQSAAFFDADDTSKRAFHTPGRSRGYVPIGAESIGATAGPVTPPDLKEAFGAGALDVDGWRRDRPGNEVDRITWPEHPPGFVAAWREYFTVMRELTDRVLHLLCDALGVDHGFLTPPGSISDDYLRVINYPAQPAPPEPGQLRAGAHTDFGLLTILAATDAPGGLEVRTQDGEWRRAPHQPGAFTINVGDLMSYLTYGAWQSGVHRVANPGRTVASTARRQSVVFFHNPAADAVLDPLASFRTADQAPRSPVQAGEWLHRQAARQRLPAGAG